jgi:hypothetical protein
MMLVLRVLKTQPLHGYAIAQRIHLLSAEELRVEEGSLHPQRMTAARGRGGGVPTDGERDRFVAR